MAPSAIRNSFFAAALLFVLLAVLATLQFRWIGEVRDAERERLQASARAAADGVAADFDREIAGALRTFGEAFRTSDAGDLASALASARSRWTADSRFPAMVSGVDVARRGPAGDWALEELDPAGALSPAPWPADLAAARESLDSAEATPDGLPASGARRGRRGPPPWMAFLRVLDEPPLFIIGAPASGRALLVRLDRRTIADEVLPALVARHFGSRGTYDVAILGSGDPRPILYRSRADFTPSPDRPPDAEVPLFSPRPGREEGGSRRPELGGPGPGGPPPPGSGPGDPSRARWVLVATHRAGSLDEAVDATRSRNLAVSAAILLLLAAAVSFLVRSAHRSASLARQQVEFVASLTHELRTPLAAIRSAGQNLSDGVVSDASRVRDYGDLIQREGRRLSGLIETALGQAGFEARGESVRGGSASLADAVSQAIEACRHLADENQAQIEVRVPPELPPVAGDEPALRTLMENLLSNAIKYGGKNGRVTVSASAAEKTVRVAVRDRGPGIPEAELPHIFEPFYRGSRANGSVSGSGLGLSLVRRIVDGLGGRIAVESRPREGTTFAVTLPLAAAAEPEGASA